MEKSWFGRIALAAIFVACAIALIWAATSSAADSNPDPRIAVYQDGSSFVCKSPVDLDLVKVINPNSDALRLQAGCTGRIGRIEVDTYQNDGVKLAQGTGVHDLVIGGGYIACHASQDGAHQDGIQAQGGVNIAFNSLVIDCGPQANSNFFVNGSGARNIVCDGCTLKANASHTALVQTSTASGLRNSTLCPDRTPFGGSFDTSNKAKSLVNVNNTILGSC